MKVPKKLITGVVGFATAAAPYLYDVFSYKIKQKEEKMKQEKRRLEQERIYAEEKHNGMIKYASVIFALASLVLTILAMKQSEVVLGIIGILAVSSYVITFLYCLEIIKEKKQNLYKIAFIIGDMLMVIVITLLFF